MALLLVLHNPFTTSSSRFIKSRTIAKLSLPSLILFFTLATAICFLCMFMIFTTSFSPKAPVVQLNSLSVSKFNISGAPFEASWDFRFTLWNPNIIWTMFVDHLEGIVSYKDNAIGVSSVKGFTLGTKEYREVRVKISTTGLEGDQSAVRAWVLEGIGKEMRGGGGVRFGMQMAVWATYRANWWGNQRVIMNPRCDLRVGFVPGVRLGRWLGKRPMLCSVPMLSE